MEIEISRFWKDNHNAEMLCKRPRVDYQISEYLFDFINQNILLKKKIKQSGNDSIMLFMQFSNLNMFTETSYDTDKTNFQLFEYKLKKNIVCGSLLFNEEMKPSEYADIVYDMFALYLIYRYKKLTKEIFDEAKKNLDYNYINSFEFPARFENQRYFYDEGSIGTGNIRYDKEKKEWVSDRIFTPREEYLKFFEK